MMHVYSNPTFWKNVAIPFQTLDRIEHETVQICFTVPQQDQLEDFDLSSRHGIAEFLCFLIQECGDDEKQFIMRLLHRQDVRIALFRAYTEGVTDELRAAA